MRNPNEKGCRIGQKRGWRNRRATGKKIRTGCRSRQGFGFGLNKMKKEWNYTGKIKILIEPSDENETKMMKTKVEYDGEEDGTTSKALP